MRRTNPGVLLLALLLAGPGRACAAAPAEPEIDLRIGGTGGAYFLAEPGELVIDLEKRDRNPRGRRTDLRAVLAGPDREVLQDVTLRRDNPPQRARLAVHVSRKGVYGLNVTVSQDRYGEAVYWGFRTNCPKYLIETSRGHRDERHQEPIVLYRPERPGNVCFMPRKTAFRIDVTDLPEKVGELSVYDGRGERVAALPVEKGRASHEFPAGAGRDVGPWRLHLPVAQATVHVDGVTRWERNDPQANLALWTPDAKSFFPLADYRWLLAPYRRTVYGKPGAPVETTFAVHNNADDKRTVRLALEFPGSPWPASLSAQHVALRPRETREVTVRGAPAEGEARVCHLRATPAEEPAFSTYSTLVLRAGEPPAARPLAMPLVLQAYRHENEQFGYVPDYPIENAYYFDLKNRPATWTARGLARWDDGRWTFHEPAVEGRAHEPLSPKIAFDRDGDLYLLASSGGRAALLRSTDGGKTFSASPLPGGRRGGAYDIEVFTGHNAPDGPPPVLRYTQTAADPKRIWRRINDLELFLPKKEGGRVTVGEPVLVSRQCIGMSDHSGSPNGVVSRDGKVHVTWAEATDPGVKVPGVPTYAATCDRATRTLTRPALVGYGPPPNDVHNSPSITIDSKGRLHVVTGTHGLPFPYARSLAPDDAGRGWTEPAVVGAGLRQTYVGLMCGPDDTLHLAFRLWKEGETPFPASHHATLAWQRKPPGKPWESPQVLVVPPLSEYSVYYHRLTIDRQGNLFLSYDYWSTYWFYRNDHRGPRRALLTSPDGGRTWKLAEGRDLVGPTSALRSSGEGRPPAPPPSARGKGRRGA